MNSKIVLVLLMSIALIILYGIWKEQKKLNGKLCFTEGELDVDTNYTNPSIGFKI